MFFERVLSDLCFDSRMRLSRNFSILFLAVQGLRAAGIVISLVCSLSSHVMQCGCVQLESLSALST